MSNTPITPKGTEPANILNPVTYADKCLPLKKLGLKIKILNLI